MAEQLFAERGFAETSLRLITSRADVHLAAVNYHFGSKKALIQAVFARFLGPFCDHLEQELDRREVEKNVLSLEELLALVVEQILQIKPRNGNDLSVFMRLLGLAVNESQGHLRKYLDEVYGDLFRRYLMLLHRASPPMAPVELFWRMNFMLGTVAFSMSGIKTLRAIVENDYGVRTSTEQVLRMMVPFLASGMQAPMSVLSQAPSGGAAANPS